MHIFRLSIRNIFDWQENHLSHTMFLLYSLLFFYCTLLAIIVSLYDSLLRINANDIAGIQTLSFSAAHTLSQILNFPARFLTNSDQRDYL